MAKEKTKKAVKAPDRFTEAFLPETDEKLQKISAIFFILGLVCAVWFSTIELVVDEIMFEDVENEELVATMDMEEKKEEKKEKKKEENKKKRKKKGGGGKQRGKGNPKAPQSRGVLKLLTTQTSKSGFSAYSLMSNKKFAKDLDKVLKNVAGLQKTGKTKLGGRRGKADAAFNSGYAEGGSGGIGDALSGLLGGGGGAISTRAKGKIKAPSARDIDMGSGGGSRSVSSIMRVVRARTPGLRHIYNKFLKTNPGFSGKVTLRFTISPGGKIVKIGVAGTTTGVSGFDSAVKGKVRRWKFEKIKSGNTTVTIPFTFSE
jgi:TonB family protein